MTWLRRVAVTLFALVLMLFLLWLSPAQPLLLRAILLGAYQKTK